MNIPNEISGFRSGIINQIIRCLRLFKINDSADIAVSETGNGTYLTLKDKKLGFSPKLQTEVKRTAMALYMVPVLREWKQNETSKKAEIVPVADETFYDDDIADADKNDLFVTWDFIRAHGDISATVTTTTTTLPA